MPALKKKKKTKLILGVGGLVSGLLNGLLGTGGGILAIPAFRMAGYQQRYAQANASVFMLAMSVVSAAVLLFQEKGWTGRPLCL